MVLSVGSDGHRRENRERTQLVIEWQSRPLSMEADRAPEESLDVALNCVARRSDTMDISSFRNDSMRDLFTYLYSEDLTHVLFDAHGH